MKKKKFFVLEIDGYEQFSFDTIEEAEQCLEELVEKDYHNEGAYLIVGVGLGNDDELYAEVW